MLQIWHNLAIIYAYIYIDRIMRLSWSHKLFFWTNKQIGRRKWLDIVMLVFSHWLIYILAFIVLSWGVLAFSEEDPARFVLFVKLLLSAFAFAIATNWLLGIMLSKRRPIVEFPRIKQLFAPYKTWKSFPSDHTTIALVLAIIPYLLGAGFCFFLLSLICAFLIGVGRVYAGVHYPRDILGAIMVAFFYSFFSFWLLSNIAQPIYTFVKNIIL